MEITMARKQVKPDLSSASAAWLKRCGRCHLVYDVHSTRCPSCGCPEYSVHRAVQDRDQQQPPRRIEDLPRSP
jgi:rRNA maturation endonuclease Nob1